MAGNGNLKSSSPASPASGGDRVGIPPWLPTRRRGRGLCGPPASHSPAPPYLRLLQSVAWLWSARCREREALLGEVAGADLLEDVEHRLDRRGAIAVDERRGDDAADGAAPGERADHHVVAYTLEGQLGEQGNADPGCDEALDGGVVVVLDLDPGLESRGVAGAQKDRGVGTRGAVVHPGLVCEVGEPEPALARQGVARWQRHEHRIVQQMRTLDSLLPRLWAEPGLDHQSDVSLARLEAVQRVRWPGDREDDLYSGMPGAE